MKPRIQVLLTREEREEFRQAAEARGMSLSGWLRQAGLQRLRRERDGKRIDSVEALRAFFEACDSDADPGREPDWDEHLEVIQESRARGRPQP